MAGKQETGSRGETTELSRGEHSEILSSLSTISEEDGVFPSRGVSQPGETTANNLDYLQPRPRSTVISRPRIAINMSEEDEVDSEDEWESYMSSSQRSSVRDSVLG